MVYPPEDWDFTRKSHHVRFSSPGKPDPGYWSEAELGVLGARLVARVLDLFVINILIIAVLSITLVLGWHPPQIGSTLFPIMLASVFMVVILYQYLLEARFQRTLGKMALQLKVVNDWGLRPTNRQLLARAILYSIVQLVYLWIIEILIMLYRQDGLTFTNIATGTRVIRFVRQYPQSS